MAKSPVPGFSGGRLSFEMEKAQFKAKHKNKPYNLACMLDDSVFALSYCRPNGKLALSPVSGEMN